MGWSFTHFGVFHLSAKSSHSWPQELGGAPWYPICKLTQHLENRCANPVYPKMIYKWWAFLPHTHVTHFGFFRSAEVFRHVFIRRSVSWCRPGNPSEAGSVESTPSVQKRRSNVEKNISSHQKSLGLWAYKPHIE